VKGSIKVNVRLGESKGVVSSIIDYRGEVTYLKSALSLEHSLQDRPQGLP
jgi:hypothetical protein